MAQVDVTVTVGPELLTVTTRTTRSGAVLLTVFGEVDMATCSLLGERIVEHLRTADQLIVDLDGVNLLCAAGLTALVVAKEKALMVGTRLCVVASTRQVRRPLMVTGLTDVLDLHADVEEALLCPYAPLLSPAGPRLADPRQPGDLR
ncbi:STAS domain-containing protein [Lentzea alba]|uniref:STAS domain-containing protein n=1 Tax=Lentzea alba TaxID=2714351 RepID=UPI0039BF6E2F